MNIFILSHRYPVIGYAILAILASILALTLVNLAIGRGSLAQRKATTVIVFVVLAIPLVLEALRRMAEAQ